MGLTTVDPVALPSKNFPNLFFPELIGSWVHLAGNRFIQRAGGLHRVLTQDSYLGFECDLAKRLEQVALPCLLLEFKALRNSFSGEADRERRRQFVETVFGNAKGRTRFFDRYPVLRDLVSELIGQYVDNTVLFLNRLDKDLWEMANRFWDRPHPFALKPPLRLKIKAGLSDPHNGGQTVCRVTFEDGVSVYYKPKDLAVVREFNQLIGQLNQWGLEPQLKTYQLVEGPGYGWVQSIDHLPCKGLEQVQRFYLRSGMNLCLMYWLQGTDMHLENVIACGEFPFFVDLETLFDNTRNIAGVKDPMLLSGLEQTLMLPFQPPRAFGKDAKDMGSLTSLLQPPNAHLCKWGEIPTPAGEYMPFVSRGFRRMYRLLQDRREVLMGPSGNLTKLASCPVRIVLRHTGLYGRMLRQLAGPDLMADGQNRDQQVDYLLGVAIKKRPNLAVILPWEKAAFKKLDIPMFLCFPNRRHLYVQDRLVGKNFFSQSSYHQVKQRFSHFGVEDCDRQDTDLQVALCYGGETDLHASGFAESKLGVNQQGALDSKNDDPLSRAVEIGHLLESKMVVDQDGYVQWRDLVADSYQKRAFLGFTGDSLHSGGGGIAVFFADLYEVTGKPNYRHLAELCIKRIKKRLERGQGRSLIRKTGLGAVAGFGGMLYALVRVGVATENPALLQLAREQALRVDLGKMGQYQVLDVFGGLAGWLLSLLKLHQVSAAEDLLIASRDCGNLLLEKLETSQEDPETEAGNRGFAFGRLGIGFSLAKLAVISREPVYEAAGRHCFQKGWPLDKPEALPTAGSWCRGKYGALLAAEGLREVLGRGGFRDEVVKRISVFSESLNDVEVTGVDHLCCGNFGRLACLAVMAQKTNHPGVNPIYAAARDAVKGKFQSRGGRFLAQFSGAYARPGLFTGLAGLGQFYLSEALQKKQLDFLTIG